MPPPKEEATPQPSSCCITCSHSPQVTQYPKEAGEAAPLQGLAQPPLCPEQKGRSH